MASHKRLSAGAVVIRDTAQGPRYLLLRAYNYWDFPKGIVESGEDPKCAAIREVCEETTIDDLEFPWGDEHIETGPYSRGKTARYYLARTGMTDIRLPPNPESGKPEHNEYRWVEYATALHLVSARVKPVLEWAAGRISGRKSPAMAEATATAERFRPTSGQ